MKVELDHMVMSGRYGGWEDNICHSHIKMLWRRDVRECGRIKGFFFHLS